MDNYVYTINFGFNSQMLLFVFRQQLIDGLFVF